MMSAKDRGTALYLISKDYRDILKELKDTNNLVGATIYKDDRGRYTLVVIRK